jgi:hypothetical protein
MKTATSTREQHIFEDVIHNVQNDFILLSGFSCHERRERSSCYTFIFCKQFYFIVSGFKITGNRNPDNNLESPCTLKFAWIFINDLLIFIINKDIQ